MPAAAPAVAVAQNPNAGPDITQLCNIYEFLKSPVDPQGNLLPGDPYEHTVADLSWYLSGLGGCNSPGASNYSLSAAQVAGLENVLGVLGLVLGRVEDTGAQIPQSIAVSNSFISTGEWGISYSVSQIISARLVDAAGQVAQVGLALADPFGSVGDLLENSADSELLKFVQNIPIRYLSLLATEVHWGTSLAISAFGKKLEELFEHAIKGKIDQVTQTLGDWLTAINGYEIDPLLAQAVASAETLTASPQQGQIAQLDYELEGPARIAVGTYEELHAAYQYGPLVALEDVLGLIPGVGTVTGLMQHLFELGGDIGGNAVDLNYLYYPIGIPDPNVLLDTLYYMWSEAEAAFLKTTETSQPAGLSMSVDAAADGCVVTGGVPTCQEGSQVGVSGVLTNANGEPLPNASVAITSSEGIPLGASVRTDSSGRFTGGVELPLSDGTQVTITASAGGAAVRSVMVDVGPAALYEVQLAGPRSVPAGGQVQVEGFATDFYGNPIPNTPIELTTSAGAVSPESTSTDAAGGFEATVHAPSDASSLEVRASIPHTFVAAAPLTLTVTQSESPPTVRLDPPSASGLTVSINGEDTASSGATIAGLTWEWGDGKTSTGWFPQSHTYAAAGTYTVKVTATDSHAQTGSATSPVTVQAPSGGSPLTLTTTSLPNGDLGSSYSAPIGISGGKPPYTTSWTGSLPPGLYFWSALTLSGTPSQGGVYTFDFTVADSSSPQQSVTKPVTVVVEPVGTLTITTTSLPPATVGVPYSATISARGGSPPYKWSRAGTTLPPGLELNETTGVISGTPTVAGGPFGFTVQASDEKGDLASEGFSMRVASPPAAGSGALVEQIAQGTNEGRLMAIKCLPNGGRADCFAAGSDASGEWQILHSTDGGASWTDESLPSGLGEASGLIGLDCPSVTVCYAGNGTQMIKTTNGADWSVLTLPSESTWVQRISCPSKTDCYVVAGYPFIEGRSEEIMQTIDGGQSWTLVSTPKFSESGISCPTTSVCWAAGQVEGSSEMGGVIETTNGGQSWTLEQTFSGTLMLNGVACTSETQCWVTGIPNTGTEDAPFVAETTDGSSWSVSYGTSQTGYLGGQVAGGVACASSLECLLFNRSARDAYSTTDGGTTAWTTYPTSSPFQGVSCVPSGACWLTTEGGAILATSINGGSLPPSGATQLAITSAPISPQPTSSPTAGPITITEKDSLGDPIAAPPGGTAVSLSSSSLTGEFAESAGGPPVQWVTIPAGASSVSVYYGDTSAGNPTVTASSGDLAAGHQQESIRGPQAITITSTPPPSATVGGTYAITAVGGASGNPVTFSVNPASTSGACSVGGSGSVAFEAVGTCIVEANQAAGGGYAAASEVQQSIVISAGTPEIDWSEPAAITYGRPLGSAQLDASSAVAGLFLYQPVEGTVLRGGKQTLSVTFIPLDTSDYQPTTASVRLQVEPARTSFAASSKPSSVSYGNAVELSASGLPYEATGTISFTAGGSTLCSVTVAAGSAECSAGILPVGSYLVSAAYSGDADYQRSSATTSFTINATSTRTTTTTTTTPTTSSSATTTSSTTTTTSTSSATASATTTTSSSPPTTTATATSTAVLQSTTSSSSTVTTSSTPHSDTPTEQASPAVNARSGEIVLDYTFPEAGRAEAYGEATGGATSAGSAKPGLLNVAAPLALIQDQLLAAFVFRHVSDRPPARRTRCAKGRSRRAGRCASNPSLLYTRTTKTIPAAGSYRIAVKPGRQARALLRKGRTLTVTVTLVFTPAGTIRLIRETATVKVRLADKHDRGKK